MKHLHKRSGHYFEVGSYTDGDRTYDITVISYWKDPETQDVGSPVELIGYYFGDYDEETTDFYIDRWFDNRSKEISVLIAAGKYFDAYLTTNRDVLDKPTIDELEQAMFECSGLLYDRSWRIDFKDPAAKMSRMEYENYINGLYLNDKIDDDTRDDLLALACNYDEKEVPEL